MDEIKIYYTNTECSNNKKNIYFFSPGESANTVKNIYFLKEKEKALREKGRGGS